VILSGVRQVEAEQPIEADRGWEVRAHDPDRIKGRHRQSPSANSGPVHRTIAHVNEALIVVAALFALFGGGIVVLDALIIRRLRRK
jgi:hypothetical protein